MKIPMNLHLLRRRYVGFRRWLAGRRGGATASEPFFSFFLLFLRSTSSSYFFSFILFLKRTYKRLSPKLKEKEWGCTLSYYDPIWIGMVLCSVRVMYPLASCEPLDLVVTGLWEIGFQMNFWLPFLWIFRVSFWLFCRYRLCDSPVLFLGCSCAILDLFLCVVQV